jgi:hypothetical protein
VFVVVVCVCVYAYEYYRCEMHQGAQAGLTEGIN